eukprot:6212544-Pleurochrysis_carterae.AAC.6
MGYLEAHFSIQWDKRAFLYYYGAEQYRDRGRLFSVLTSRPEYYHSDSRARPTVTYKLSPRAPFICKSAHTCTVSQSAVASHAYLRSARAPLPRLWKPRSRMPAPLLSASDLEPPRVGALGPRACARSLTVASRVVDRLAITRPPRTVALSYPEVNNIYTYTPDEGVRGCKKVS